MTFIISKIISFIMAVITFVFPFISFGKPDYDLELVLDANPSTGYTWECDIDDESVISLVGNKYIAGCVFDGIVGSSGKEYFYFKAVSQGEATITFTYAQNWQGGETAETVTYEVTVHSDYSVEALKTA